MAVYKMTSSDEKKSERISKRMSRAGLCSRREAERWVLAGGTSMASGGPPVVHFGLGDMETMEKIEIFWANGLVEAFTNIPINRKIHIAFKLAETNE